MLARLAQVCYRRRGRVLIAWLAAIVAVMAIGRGLGGDNFHTEFVMPDSESREVVELFEEVAPGRDTTIEAQVVFAAEQGVNDPAVVAAMEGFFARMAAEVPEVPVVSPYATPAPGAPAGAINPAGTMALAPLLFAGGDQTEIVNLAHRIVDAGESVQVEGLRIAFAGDPFVDFSLPESELIGILAAVIILVIAFGSVLAMGLSIGTAIIGLFTGVGLITIGTNVMTMPDFTLQIGAMIGLGVGIDYALFIVTRFREHLHAHGDPERATIVAIDSAGRAVLFAGITVVISLLGMLIMGLAFIRGLAVGGSLTVAVMVIASLTLLPALLGFVRERIDVTTRAALLGLIVFAVVALFGILVLHTAALLPIGLLAGVAIVGISFAKPAWRTPIAHRAPKPREQTGWYRWSRQVQHHPWLGLLVGGGALVLMALPVFSLRLGFTDNGNRPEAQQARIGYDMIAEGFGPGFNGPLIVATRQPLDPAAVEAFTATLGSTPGVALAGPGMAMGPAATVWRVIPTTGPQEVATEELVHRLRDEVIATSGVDAVVGGYTAVGIDMSDFFRERLPVFFAAVLLLSFLLLMAVFRSLLVPLKAVVMNLLSIGAAYGVLVAVFQWGWGASLIGVGKGGPIEPFIPMMLFAIVFGLSMDYEVFLLSRMKEEFDRTGDNATAVADGLAATARVITAAAIIMVCVFGSFIAGDERVVKTFGLGLAVAVLIDATLVRMLLVPATMELLGARNWWIPRWLDRILPQIHVEGHADDRAAELIDSEPTPVRA